MRIESHQEILKEVLNEIASALHDKDGLLAHQRRLAFALSLGAVNLLEMHLYRLQIIKEGAKIDHRWFKKKEEKIKENLQRQITSPIDSLDSIKKILETICDIEKKRDELAYGAPTTEKLLQEKINLFFELKELLQC